MYEYDRQHWDQQRWGVGNRPKQKILADIAEDKLTIHHVHVEFTANSLKESIRSTTIHDGSFAFKRRLRADLAKSSDMQIKRQLALIDYLLPIIQNAINIVSRYDIRMRAIHRIAAQKSFSFTPENLAKAALDPIVLKTNYPLNLSDRLLLTQFVGVDMTEFYWDPPCVRSLSCWWVFYYDFNADRNPELPPPEACETFLQRLAMYHDYEDDQLTSAWNMLFSTLNNIGVLEDIVGRCVGKLKDPLSYKDIVFKTL